MTRAAAIGDAFLNAKGIVKTFRAKNGPEVTALDGVTLTVRRGGVTALVGPDGAGKTTLIRIIAGLLAPNAGSLSFASETSPVIGYMPQKFGLYEDLTIRENLDLYADLRALPHSSREKRYAELLDMAGLAPFTARLAGKLSGGMKQKLGLICTLLTPPNLLLLDEPTVGVDPLSRRELWEIIQKLTAQAGASVIMSTSYMDEAARCDEVVLLFEGAALASGTPESIRRQSEGMAYLANPARDETPRALQARLLDLPGVIDAVPQGGAVRLVHGELTPENQAALHTALNGAAVKTVPSSLEDSFMLLLKSRGSTPEGIAFSGGSAAMQNAKAENNGPVIETRNVSRLFGDFIAVNDVSFSVNRGEVFGLLGPNGAGKTTTFRMLCGLLPPSKGSLYVAGVDVTKAREEARRHLGYVAQKFSLYGPLSVKENLEFFAGAYGLYGKTMHDRMNAMVDEFSLGRFLNSPAENLPGGYRQRLAMAVGLLHEPDILFLDEPTSGADPLARRDFWKRIAKLADRGVTIVVTTHFMEEAEYCDQVLIQDNGMKLALGSPAEIRAEGGEENATMEDAFIAIVKKARRKNGGKAA